MKLGSVIPLNNDPNETRVCNTPKKRSEDSPFFEVNKCKSENPKNITLYHLNVNSLRNKFVPIEELIKTIIGIFLASETKNWCFKTVVNRYNGYKVHRKDWSCFGGELLIYLNGNIFCEESTAAQTDSSFEQLFLNYVSWKNIAKWKKVDNGPLQTTKSKGWILF